MRYRIYVDAFYTDWSKNGLGYRLDGPSLEWRDGGKSWRLNGKFHRLDGPAREFSDGYKSWWLNGIEYSEGEFKRIQSGKK